MTQWLSTVPLPYFGRIDSVLSSEKALEDFLRRALLSPLRVQLEASPLPAEVQAVRQYDAETDRLMEVCHANG